jgi:hypothetical protein
VLFSFEALKGRHGGIAMAPSLAQVLADLIFSPWALPGAVTSQPFRLDE